MGRAVATATLVLVLATATAVATSSLARDGREAVGRSLSAVLETTDQGIHSWVRENRASATVWASTPTVRNLTRDLLAVERTQSALLAAPAQTELRSYLAPVLAESGYMGFFVIAPDGTNLGSTRDANVGVPSLLLPQRAFIDRIYAGESAASLPLRSDVPLRAPGTDRLEAGLPTMFVGAPVRDSGGNVSAIFVFRIDPYRDFSAVFERGRIGTTGEAYAFDGEGRLLTESRFDEELRRLGLLAEGQWSMLGVEVRVPDPDRPLTRMAQEAIEGRDGVRLDPYRSYLGPPVVGAWRWDDDLHLGMAVEMDAQEAFAAFHRTRAILFTLSALGAFLLVVVSWHAHRREVLERRLEDAMAKVLSGYLPMCANCKKIRQDEGPKEGQEAPEWLPVEAHISRATDVLFSHTFCPECMVELYGDVLDD